MPACRTMDSHPYHRNQMPFPHYYHPGYETIHPQMKMDPSKPPVVYEQSWPLYAAGYSYPASVHFCCGHNSFPGYCGSRLAYPHVPSPSTMYYPGHSPAYPDPYSIPCTPPPHYNMEIPRYEYDKCVPEEYQYHCCGCPNHPCHQKEGSKSVKIEEQEPEVEKKVNDALVPAESRNYRYPFVWIPPEYMNNQEQKKPIQADMGGPDKITRDAKHPEYSKAGGREEPRVWNGWFPFDMNSLPSMILDRDGRINQNLQSENNRKQSKDGERNQNGESENKSGGFPFPIIWMPFYNKQDEDGRKNNQEATSSTSSPKSIEEVSQNHIYKTFPVNFIAGEKAAKGTNSEEVSTNMGGSNVTEKANKEKSIPVKQMELHQGNDDSENSGRIGRNIPVKQMKEDMAEADRESKTNVKIESTSPRKTSNLPPVCLRVDPLPRKSNGNGSSRSPSPSASKEHSRTTVGGTSKSTSLTTSEKAQPDSKLHNASNASEISKNSSSSTTTEKALLDSKLNASNASENVQPKDKFVEVLEKKTNGNEDENQMGGHESSSGTSMRKESYAKGDECKTEENRTERKEEPVVEEKATEGRRVSDSNKTVDQCKMEKEVLSGVEAAVLIQAAYRGFQVRKWEPLKKLKQISEVSKQVTEVSESIRAIEASADLQNDDRQRLTIGETIMRLLLKLDTIQGLHPSFREIRKSLARELTSLQEKLDSMMSKKSEQHMQDSSATKSAENVHWGWQDGKHACEQREQIASSVKNSESNNQEHHDILKTCQDQICVEDSISNIKPEEKLAADGSRESWPPVSPIDNNNEGKPGALQHEITNGDGVQVEAVDECNSENGPTEMENTAVENTPKPEVKGTPIEADDLVVTALKELTQCVIDEQPVNLESGKNIKAELGRFEPQHTGGVTMMMDDNSTLHGEVYETDAIKELPEGILDEDPQDGEASEIDAIKELPGGIMDEVPMMAQSKKHETECEPSNEAMQELPVGLLDEEQKSIELEKCEESETSEKAIAELPAGFLMLSSQCEKPEQTDTSREAMAELPVGLLDGYMTGFELEEHEESKTFHEVLVAKDDEHEGTAQMNASTDSTPSKNQTEQQQQMPLDDHAELQSTETEESDGWVKVGSQIYDKHHDPLAEGTEFECHLEEGIRGDNEQAPYQSVPLLSEAPENGNMNAEQVIGAVADNREIMARRRDEQHDGGVNNDKKLIEENKKLREMMKKLLDAGNEQLNVISDLTGRVRDLEKKLAKKKRLRTKGFRPGARKPCLKSK